MYEGGRRALGVGVALAAIAVSSLTGPTAAPARSTARVPCRPSGSEALARSRQVRVYRADDVVYACLVSRNRRTRLGRDDQYLNDVVVHAVVGTQVAYEITSIPGCKGACPPDVNPSDNLFVLSMRRRTIRRVSNQPVDARAVLTGTGAIAFLESGVGGYDLVVDDAEGRRVLDSGAIDPASLRVAGTAVTWTNAGVPKSAPLG